MPPLAKNKLDDAAVLLIRNWILEMDPLPVELDKLPLPEELAVEFRPTMSEKVFVWNDVRAIMQRVA